MKPSELLARVRGRKPTASPPAASAKRSRKVLTCGDLASAIFAVCSEMRPCTARTTLEALNVLTDYGDTASAGNIVALDGAAPISCAQLDDALIEARKFDLPAGTLSTLTRFRKLLAEAEARKAKEPAQYITGNQFRTYDATVFDLFGWMLGATCAELNRAQPSEVHMREMLCLTANTPERQRVLKEAGKFNEGEVRQRTQEERLRYQTYGHY